MAQKRFLKTLGDRINKLVGSDTRNIIIPTEQTSYEVDKATIRKRALIFFSILGLGSLFQYGYGFALHYFGGYSYPYTSPLFLPEDRFMDFFNIPYFSKPGEIASYSAFTFLLAKAFSLFIGYGGGRFEARFSVGGILIYSGVVFCYLVCL
jgi:hypothetical protein